LITIFCEVPSLTSEFEVLFIDAQGESPVLSVAASLEVTFVPISWLDCRADFESVAVTWL